MNAREVLETLLEIQALEIAETKLDQAAIKVIERKIAELRLQLPLPVLNHYDRLRVREMKCVAQVKNETCSGCEVRVTQATISKLTDCEDILICESCGRYLYLPKITESDLPDTKAGRKPANSFPDLETLPDAA